MQGVEGDVKIGEAATGDERRSSLVFDLHGRFPKSERTA